ncbi:MAG: RusA family crossover junction endodeoxyribonuclease [Eggerthella lenta]|nr:RusA family crossover junction endodeoxyribonuclease [Eggerthella lenta]
MRQEFEVPGRLDGMNEYTAACRSHAQMGGRVKRRNQEAVCRAIKAAGLKPMRTPVNVRITWYEKPKRPGSRMRDRDNIQFAVKFVLDALVEMGVIPDDGFDDVGDVKHECYRASENPRIIIELEEA